MRGCKPLNLSEKIKVKGEINRLLFITVQNFLFQLSPTLLSVAVCSQFSSVMNKYRHAGCPNFQVNLQIKGFARFK